MPVETKSPPLGRASVIPRLSVIGAVLLAAAGSFAWVGGWFTPHALTPGRLVDVFEEVDGTHPGYRRNHARGLGVTGYFESNGKGVRLSKAAVFQPGVFHVVGRFSLSGGHPGAPDMAGEVRGLGLQIFLANGQEWRTAMVNLPLFPFRTPEAFYERLLASKPSPSTGKPDPAKMAAFLTRHPETARAMEALNGYKSSSGFANSTFNSLNAFRFVNEEGQSVPVRWTLVPEQPPGTTDSSGPAGGKNYLFDELADQLKARPLKWHLVVVVGQPDDPTDDATAAWPEGREKVRVGTLTLDRAWGDEASPATDITFDPLVLPTGIEPSNDPLLSARSAAYSQSFTRRAGEGRPHEDSHQPATREEK